MPQGEKRPVDSEIETKKGGGERDVFVSSAFFSSLRFLEQSKEGTGCYRWRRKGMGAQTQGKEKSRGKGGEDLVGHGGPSDEYNKKT